MRVGARGGRGYTAQTRRRCHALCFRRSPAAMKRQNFTEAEQICRCKFTLRLYGVTHYTLRCKECAIRSLWTPQKAATEQKQYKPIASASLQPYGSFRYKHTRSLYLICRVEVDNILTYGSNVSLCNGRVYPLLPPPRPPFSRRRLCICGGSFHIFDDTARVVILSTWSKRSLTIRCLLFSQK